MKTFRQIFKGDNSIDTVRQINRQIGRLKTSLADSDYKVIKCMEATLANKEMPYDVQLLHYQRQMTRREINLLEEKIRILKETTL